MNNTNTVVGISFSGLCLLWGVVTQCLNWAGILYWPWYAIWGPFLFVILAWIFCFLLATIIVLIFRR